MEICTCVFLSHLSSGRTFSKSLKSAMYRPNRNIHSTCYSFLKLSCNNQISVNGSDESTVPINYFLHFIQTIQTFIYRKIRKLPFNYVSKPNKGSHVIKFYGREGFLGANYFKPGFFKSFALDVSSYGCPRERRYSAPPVSKI